MLDRRNGGDAETDLPGILILSEPTPPLDGQLYSKASILHASALPPWETNARRSFAGCSVGELLRRPWAQNMFRRGVRPAQWKMSTCDVFGSRRVSHYR